MKLTNKEQRRQAQYARLNRLIEYYKRDLAKRLAETRKLFGRRVCIVDIHTHSIHSDGLGTVEENAERVQRWGLDFFFATDHASLRQKRAVSRIRFTGWGQEPNAGSHHIGLLCNRRRFLPRKDSIAADWERAKQLAPFVWIPHPAGWYPGTRYSHEQLRMLRQLGDAFALEVMNGANKVVRAYDEFDQQAVKVWDQLLCEGKRVTAVAGSDAHSPDDIGTVWTGVFAQQSRAPSIIRALNQGLCFASEASLMDFSCNGRTMGSTLHVLKGVTLALRFRVADSAGIASVRIISQSKIIREIFARGRTVVEGTLTRTAPVQPAYYRLESTSADDRRAFSTPLYTEPVRR